MQTQSELIREYWDYIVEQRGDMDLLEFLGNLLQWHTFAAPEGDMPLICKMEVFQMMVGYSLAKTGEMPVGGALVFAKDSMEVIKQMIREVEGG